MAEGRLDYHELDDFGEKQEEENNEEETTFMNNNDDLQRELDNLRNLTIEGIGSETETKVDISGYTPDPTSDNKVINTSITNDRKKFLEDKLGINIYVKDGQASQELLKEMVVTFNVYGKADGINYKDKKVVVSNDGGKTFKYSQNKKYSDITNRFRILLNKAVNDHNNTPEGVVEQHLTSEGVAPNDDLTNNIISNINENIDTELDEYQTIITLEARKMSIDEQEIKELAGSLNPIGTSDAMIDSLETQANTYRQKAKRETDPVKKSFYKSVSDAASLKADYICMKNGIKLEHDEANSIIENEVRNNDLTQLEKFKRWAKDNPVGVSALAISIASIITTIVIGARKALKKDAQATGKFAKAVYNLGKKLGPLLAPILIIIAQAITWGAKGLAWLSKNLWLLAFAVTWFIYDQYKQRRRK